MRESDEADMPVLCYTQKHGHIYLCRSFKITVISQLSVYISAKTKILIKKINKRDFCVRRDLQ